MKIILTMLAMTVVSCGHSESQLHDIREPTNLALLGQTLPVVSLVRMGSPFNPDPCQGYQLTYSSLAKILKLQACQGTQRVNKNIALTSTTERQLIANLAHWKVEPVPDSAYSAPCPAFDGGGFRAEGLGDNGLESYSFFACKDMIPDGVLQLPSDNNAIDLLEQWIATLL